MRDACSNDNLVLLVGSNARACAYMSRHLKAWSRKNSQANELRSRFVWQDCSINLKAHHTVASPLFSHCCVVDNSMLTGTSVQEVCASESHWPEPGKRLIVIVIRVEVAAPTPFVTPSSLTASLVEKFAADKAAGSMYHHHHQVPSPLCLSCCGVSPRSHDVVLCTTGRLAVRRHSRACCSCDSVEQGTHTQQRPGCCCA